MSEYDYLNFTLELLNLMIDEIQNLEWKSEIPENMKRLQATHKHLSIAYTYAEPIIERGTKI